MTCNNPLFNNYKNLRDARNALWQKRQEKKELKNGTGSLYENENEIIKVKNKKKNLNNYVQHCVRLSFSVFPSVFIEI